MATIFWRGDADAVAQVSSASIDSLDATPANNTFHVTIGDEVISQVGTTDAATTAAALVALLNASTHPYFAAVTWTNPSGGTITGTADTAGVPFVAALTETGAGTGAVTDFSDDTASSGPCDLGAADNYSGGALPANGDTLIIADVSSNIAYNLDALAAVTLAHLQIRQTFLGLIGLRSTQFATSADALTYSTTRAAEYRETYLKVGADRITNGAHGGIGTPVGSQRVKIDNVKSGASMLDVINTATTSADTGLPAVRYKAAHADADVNVRAAPGGVGVAMDAPDETSTIGDAQVVSGSFSTGRGVTMTSLEQYGGTSRITASATVATMSINGGACYTDGDFTVTELNVQDAGIIYLGHRKTGGNCATTVNLLAGGTLDVQVTPEARTFGTLNLLGGTFRGGDHLLATVALNLPARYWTMTIE